MLKQIEKECSEKNQLSWSFFTITMIDRSGDDIDILRFSPAVEVSDGENGSVSTIAPDVHPASEMIEGVTKNKERHDILLKIELGLELTDALKA